MFSPDQGGLVVIRMKDLTGLALILMSKIPYSHMATGHYLQCMISSIFCNKTFKCPFHRAFLIFLQMLKGGLCNLTCVSNKKLVLLNTSK